MKREYDNKRILVLDDDPNVRQLIGMVLKHRGFRVSVAKDPEHARERMRLERFEVLVTDHDMPQENGLSFVKKMRQGHDISLGTHHTNIPVVMVSARDEPEYIQEVKDAGVQAFVQKPFAPTSFAQLIEKLATEKRSMDFVQLPTLN